MLFLETLTNTDLALGGGVIAGLIAIMAAFLIVFFLIAVGVYIYFSLAFMSIGKKAGLQCPGVAWINPIISIFEISRMHWWPWPVVFLGIFIVMLSMLLSPFLGLVLYVILILFALIMTLIWHWKTFEAVNRPGWWILVPVILSVLGFFVVLVSLLIGIILMLIGVLVYSIFIGIAAWGK